MLHRYKIAMFVLILLFSSTGFVMAASYTITATYDGIPLIPFNGMPNAGGYSVVHSFDEDFYDHTYLDHNGTITDIGTLGGSKSVLTNVNDYGQVVGSSLTSGDAASHAFLWSNGTMSDLGTLGGATSQANFINNSGLAAGNSYIAGDQYQHAFFYKNGSMSDLGTLGGNVISASHMNENGQIVGTSTLLGDDNSHAFLWSNGSMTDLGTLGGSYISSQAIDINTSGQVVGACSTSKILPFMLVPDSTTYRPFLYSNGTMIDINDLVDEPHAPFQMASSIDDSGQIVVYGSQMIDWGLYNCYTYVLTPVPEPSTFALLSLGAIAFMASIRLQRIQTNKSRTR
jgi:probable HAF family extracellular repeat protein